MQVTVEDQAARPRAGAAGARPRGTRRPRDARKHAAHAAFLLPALAFFVIFAIVPIGVGAFYSLMRWQGVGNPATWTGLDNYRHLLHDRLFWSSMEVTLKFVAAVVPGLLVLGLITALVLHRQRWFTSMTRTAVLIPLAMSPVAVGIMFQLMTSPSTGLLSRITGNPNLLNSGGAALTYVIAAQVWSLLGVVTFIFLSGLQAIPEDLYEAAQIDGAGPVRRFWNVTWPLLHGTVTVCVVYVLAMAFRSFSLILALTQGGPYRATEVLALRMYNVAFGTFDRGYGSAVATSLFLIIAAAVLLQLAWIRRDPLRER